MKYSVRSTYHLVYSQMWDFDRKLIYYGIAEVLFSAITPLVGVFSAYPLLLPVWNNRPACRL